MKAEFVQEVDNWRMRRKWKDDPFRLLYEILRIGHRVDEEFFWTGKVLNYGTDSNPKFICFEEIQLESYSQGKFESFG